MKLIADSGSTKTAWMLGNESKPIFEIDTIGLNPYFVSEEDIIKILNQHMIEYAADVKEIFFYGSGCGNEKQKDIIRQALQKVFIHASVEVNHDLLGSALATCFDSPGIACIIGTGCNACVFDGSEITKEMTSLGYILGDEGSGTYFGKKLLTSYFYDEMPKALKDSFQKKYEITLAEALQKIYKESLPNRYLASFAEFLSLHGDDEFCQQIVKEGFENFFRVSVLKFPERETLPIHFVGSIAFHFQNILNELATKYNLQMGKTVYHPIEELYTYHFQKSNHHA